MDVTDEVGEVGRRHALLITALAPLVPQILGSAFNIWYNSTVVKPMLASAELQQRFVHTVIIYNAIAFPLGIWLWCNGSVLFRPLFID